MVKTWSTQFQNITLPSSLCTPFTNAWFQLSPSLLRRCRFWTSAAARFSKWSAFCRQSFYPRSWFKRCTFNLQESWLFSLAHHKLSAAIDFSPFFFFGRHWGDSAPIVRLEIAAKMAFFEYNFIHQWKKCPSHLLLNRSRNTSIEKCSIQRKSPAFIVTAYSIVLRSITHKIDSLYWMVHDILHDYIDCQVKPISDFIRYWIVQFILIFDTASYFIRWLLVFIENLCMQRNW